MRNHEKGLMYHLTGCEGKGKGLLKHCKEVAGRGGGTGEGSCSNCAANRLKAN